MSDKTTDLVIRAKAIGFDRVNKTTKALNKETAKMTKELTGHFKDLAKSQQSIADQMDEVKRGSDAYKKLSTELKRVKRDAKETERALSGVAGLAKRGGGAPDATVQPRRAGAFTQGFAQGTGLGGEFLNRGPGMGRQIAGRTAGRMVRGAGTLAGTPFSGMGGLSTAAAGIPVVGGVISGVLNQAQAASGQALQFDRTSTEGSPFIRRAGRAGRGSDIGFSRQDMLTRQVEMSKAAGGSGAEIQRGGFSRRAAVLERAFGVDGGTVGSFVGAQRQGGTVGKGDKILEETLRDGLRAGLEGSELTDYMQQTAQGIKEWQSTGIPVNTKSMGDMTRVLAATGMGGARGANLARSISAGAAQIGEQGPTGGASMLALQTLGGFQGGGPEDFLQARMKMAKKDFSGEDVVKLFKQFQERAGGEGSATGIQAAEQAFKQLFGNFSVLDAEGLARGDEDAISRVTGQQRRGSRMADKNFNKLARGSTAGSIAKGARIEDEKLRAGRGALSTVQNLESAQANTLSASMKALKGPIEKLSGMAEGAAVALNGFMQNQSNMTAISKAVETGTRTGLKTLPGIGPIVSVVDMLTD